VAAGSAGAGGGGSGWVGTDTTRGQYTGFGRGVNRCLFGPVEDCCKCLSGHELWSWIFGGEIGRAVREGELRGRGGCSHRHLCATERTLLDSMMGWLLIVFVFALPVIGLAVLSIAVSGYRSRRLARPCCPACGYDETGRDPDSPCPECGRSRAEALGAAFPGRAWIVAWPAIAPVLVAVPFVYFSPTFGPGERVWAVACLCAPFLWLALVGLVSAVYQWPRVAWICVGIPALLTLAAAAWTYTDLAQPMKLSPGMDSYVPTLHRQIGPLVFAGGCGLVIGVLHLALAASIALLGRRGAQAFRRCNLGARTSEPEGNGVGSGRPTVSDAVTPPGRSFDCDGALR
jgi:hypothetical protein